MSVENDCYKNLLSDVECKEIARKAFNDACVILISYDIVPASSDTIGYLGDYYKLNLVIKKTANKLENVSFFIKSLPLRNQVHKAVISRLKFMDKETTLYSLFEKMKEYSSYKWHPNMYLYREDILVLEDLMQSNYKHRNFNMNASPTYIWSVLKCLAALHANSLVYEVKTGTKIGTDYLHIFNRTITKGNTWVNSGLKSIYTLAKIHPKFQTIEYQNFIKIHLAIEVEKVHEMGKISQHYRNTLCHRDLWENNMLFKENFAASNDDDSLQCILVDFQVTRYIPPSIDVSLFLYMNLNRAHRKASENKYLNYYYEWLSRFSGEMGINIGEEIPREEFDKTLEEFKLIRLVLTCVYAPIVFLPDYKILKQINLNDPIRFQQIMNGDRSEFALEHIGKFKEYGERVMEAIEELVEYLYANKTD